MDLHRLHRPDNFDRTIAVINSADIDLDLKCDPTPSPSAPTCGTDQSFDIELNICVDLCLGVLNALGVCVDADIAAGVDLPVVGGLIGGLL